MPYPVRQNQIYRTADRPLWLAAVGLGVFLLAASVGHAQSARARYPMTPSEIVSAMQGRQLPTSGVEVRLAAPITAASANPALEIQSIALLGPREMRLRIACRDRSACLPFFAIARFPAQVNSTLLPVKVERQPGSTALTSATQSETAAPPILHSGSPASLYFDGDRVHVRLEVICLEAGALGDKVRVTTRDRKQVFVAEIVNPTLLKGTLTQ